MVEDAVAVAVAAAFTPAFHYTMIASIFPGTKNLNISPYSCSVSQIPDTFIITFKDGISNVVGNDAGVVVSVADAAPVSSPTKFTKQFMVAVSLIFFIR